VDRPKQHAPVTTAIEPAEAAGLLQAARRAAMTRGCTWSAAEDVAQETLARVLVAAPRLDRAARLPFAVTTARNLAVDGHRTAARERRNQHRLLDHGEATQPPDEVLAAERSQALDSALAGLDPADREALVSHSDGASTADLADLGSSTPGAVAARLARSRARLRLDYVLALRRVVLPTPLCRPVLMAVSASDQRRQRALGAAGHLANCAACTELVPPLAQRRSALAGIATAPLVLLGAVGGRIARVSQHPAAQAGAVVGVAGGVAAAVLLGGGGRQPPATVSARPPAIAAPPAQTAPAQTLPAQLPPAALSRVGWLRSAGGAPVELGDVSRLVGQPVTAVSAPVQSVVSYPGFWVGTSPSNRVYVHVINPERIAQPVKEGTTLSFAGIVVGHRPGFARSDGVQAGEGRAQLDTQGAHLEVPAASLHQP